MVVDKILYYLSTQGKTIDQVLLDEIAKQSAWSFSRQFGEQTKSDGALRLSSIGKCQRQLAYGLHQFPHNGKEIDSRAKMVFFQGDMAELAVIGLLKHCGVNIVETGAEQAKCELIGISGHPDGIIDVDGKRYLLEVKSMSSFSFDRFDRGEIDQSYIYQVNAYMKALGLDSCIFIAMNKDSGVLGEKIINIDGNIVQDICDRIFKIMGSEENDLPDQDYHPDEKGMLPWQCLYCSWWKTCRPSAEKVLVGRSYKLKEVIK